MKDAVRMVHAALTETCPAIPVYPGLCPSKGALPYTVVNVTDMPVLIQTEGNVIESMEAQIAVYADTEAMALQILDCYTSRLSSPSALPSVSAKTRCMGVYTKATRVELEQSKRRDGPTVWRGVAMINASFERQL